MNFDEDFSVITPGCGCHRFAVPTFVYRQWHRDKSTWFCPGCGSRRHFTGESIEQRELRETKERLEQERRRASEAETRATETKRQYSRMKKRIKAGVCPCCNRTFQNVAQHMASEHPDFGSDKNVKTLRLLYGLSQTALAKELGISSSYVSSYESGKYCPGYAKLLIEEWLKREQTA